MSRSQRVRSGCRSATVDAIRANSLKKGDVLGVARVAGIMAAKRTSDAIPLCHPVALTDIQVEFTLDDSLPGIRVQTLARTVERTGVEMEALVAASTALLTIYDMAKAIDRGMTITSIALLEKTGGASGDWKRAERLDAPRLLQHRRRFADVSDVIGNRLIGSPHRKHERRILRIGGVRHVDHQVAASIYHCLLEALDCAQQVSEIGGIFISADFHSLLKKSARQLDGGAGDLLAAMRIEHLVELFGAIGRHAHSVLLVLSARRDARRVPLERTCRRTRAGAS